MNITRTKSFLLTCLLAFALCSIFTAKTFGQGGTLRVDSTANAGGDGSSWTSAYKTLWAALDFVNLLDGNWEFWVAQGTYTTFGQESPFIIDGKDGELTDDTIVLLGGYAGLNAPSGISPDARDPKLYPTILSGDIGGVAGNMGEADGPFPDGKGALSDSTRFDNAVNVLLVTSSGRGNRIEGFIIEGGIGGAKLFPNEIINMGGGIMIIDSAIDIVNCTFRFNAVGQLPPEGEINGRFGEGGAAWVIGGQLMTSGEVDYTRFINCVFHDNLASLGGALALIDGPLANIPTQVKVINSLFYDNQALAIAGFAIDGVEGAGGAMLVIGKNPNNGSKEARIEVTNCTVVNNHAADVTGGLRVVNIDQNFETLVQNSVFWGNFEKASSTTGSQIKRIGSNSTPSKISVRYSDVEGGLSVNDPDLDLVAVIDLDPDFVDEANKNFRVPETSPLVEAGDPDTQMNQLIPDDAFDLDDDGDFGELTPGLDLYIREYDSDNVGGAQVDMGVYEFFPKCCADVVSSSLNHLVNVTDLLALLGAWGCCPGLPEDCLPGSCPANSPDTCPADINRDCVVNVTDLLALLAAWGECTSICGAPGSSQQPASITSTQFPSLAAYGGQYGPVSDTWTSTSQTGLRLAADEFKPLQSTSVTNVNWWGFYEQSGADCVGNYFDSFTVKYYNAALHSGTGQLVPGSVIASFPNVSVFMKIDTGQTLGNGIPLYFYTANHAAVSVSAGATYFVEIRNTGGDTTGSSGCHWRWAWSIDGTLLYSARKPEGYSSYLSTANPENTMNLAYGLDIEIQQMELIPPPEPDPEPDPDPDPPPPGGEEDPPGGGRVMG